MTGVRKTVYRRIDASTWEITAKTYTPSTPGMVNCRTEVVRVPWCETPEDVRALAIRTGARTIKRVGNTEPEAISLEEAQ